MDLNFRWGRIDDEDGCNYKQGRLPSAETGLESVISWMNMLGLKMLDMVALMGAHTLGNTHIANSGYGVPADTGGPTGG